MSDIQPWITRRFLRHLNQAQAPEEIIPPQEKTRSLTAGATPSPVNPEKARDLLSAREQLPNRRFSSLEEIMERLQIRRDQLAELIASFSQPADEAFRRQMTDQLLGSNWTLAVDNTVIRDEVRFREVVDTPSRFCDLVATRVESLAYQHIQHAAAARLVAASLHDKYLDSYPEAAVGSYALALWFYRFDQDNWFSFDRVQQLAAQYLESSLPHSERLELRFFKGFQNSGVLVEGICPDDLPVVVNYEEQKISIWRCSLLD